MMLDGVTNRVKWRQMIFTVAAQKATKRLHSESCSHLYQSEETDQ